MNIFQVVGLGIVSLLMFAVLKEEKKGFEIFVVIGFGILVFGAIFTQLTEIWRTFEKISSYAKVNELYLTTIFKVVGVAYLGEFAAEVCRDGGSQAIAAKIELAVKVIILTLAMPIFLAILQTVVELLP